jgi:DNA polymerase III subunit epsilon
VKRDRRLLTTVVGAVVATALLLMLWIGLIAALAWGPLTPGKRDALFDLLVPSLPAAVVALLVILGLVAAAVPPLYRRWVAAPARLLEQARRRATQARGERRQRRRAQPGTGGQRTCAPARTAAR